MIDPVRFRRILIQLLKVLIIIELVGAFLEGSNAHNWSRFGVDLIIAGILYVAGERITSILQERRDSARKRMEQAGENIHLWDALIFSLLWTDQIYAGIPPDRRRLVVISYTLIAFGLVAAFVRIGSGLMPLVIAGGLVLGAVNLITWLISLERGERETLQTELRLAHDVQVSLMPKEQPAIAGFDIAGMSVPAKEVGGDLFDFQYLGEGQTRFGISVVDVSGKGMQAAMAAVFTSGAYASEARQFRSPADVLSRLNRAVYDHSRRGHFVSFLLAGLDAGTRTLYYANAGQTKPLLRAGGDVRWLDVDGVHFPLGAQPETTYRESALLMAAGDIVCLLTDGFTEAMNEMHDPFGQERVEEVFRRPDLSTLTASEIVSVLVQQVHQHTGEAPQHDDMTMVVIKAVA
jgi:serine phosphatase RsbU (regulator of sigma subunit)